MDVQTNGTWSATTAEIGGPNGEHRVEPALSVIDLIKQITETVEHEANLENLMTQIGASLEKALLSCDPGAQGSIWLTDYPPEDAEGRIIPSLVCREVFGRDKRWPENKVRRFDPRLVQGKRSVDGLIGWVALNRETINVLVRDTHEDLPDGTKVQQQYIPWDEGQGTEAELTVPMLYKGRLVGVLNLERPDRNRFSDELALIAQVVALHSAQAIHQQQVDHLYATILGESNIVRLSKMVVTEVAKILEAPFAGVFLWDVPTQCLRLAASTATILNDESRILETGDPSFEVPGVGFARWSFDQRMWLNVRDSEIYDAPGQARHAELKEEVRWQIQGQLFGAANSQAVSVREIDGPEGDDRRFWRFTGADGKVVDVPQPVWLKKYVFRAGHARAIVTVPLADPRGSRSMLGALLFARAEPTAFTDVDLALLQAMARHLSQAILLSQTARAQDMERKMISEIVTMEPASWREEFQHRLEQHLEGMQRILGGDVALLVRVLEHSELPLVANYPKEEQLGRLWGRPNIAIPRVSELGIGGSGLAAQRKAPVHFGDETDEICHAIRAAVGDRPREEVEFVNSLRSETGVPLMVGGKVVGTLTAISASPARQIVAHKDGHWTGHLVGVHEHHEQFLQSCAQWLGPALEPIQELVRRSRQLSSLSTLVQNLTRVIRSKDEPILSRLVAMLTATHHDGLGLHQAFIARCERGDTLGSPTTIRAEKDFAWGCRDADEQSKAHYRGAELQVELDQVLKDSTPYCGPLRRAWSRFRVEVPLPLAPCLITRDRSGIAEFAGRTRVLHHSAHPGDGLWKLLNAFCGLFDIAPDSKAGGGIQLGMVRLDDLSAPRPASVLFVTNVGFSRTDRGSEPYFDPITRETMEVLQDIGSLLALARGVAGQRRRAKQTRHYMQKVYQILLDHSAKSSP
jgi:GAF domain-containing protein